MYLAEIFVGTRKASPTDGGSGGPKHVGTNEFQYLRVWKYVPTLPP